MGPVSDDRSEGLAFRTLRSSLARRTTTSREPAWVGGRAKGGLVVDPDAALNDLASDRAETRAAVSGRITGVGRTAPGHEGPARKVAGASADAAPGLRSTAEKLDLGFVSLGHQPVEIRVNPDRREKQGVADLQVALEDTLANVDDAGVRWMS